MTQSIVLNKTKNRLKWRGYSESETGKYHISIFLMSCSAWLLSMLFSLK